MTEGETSIAQIACDGDRGLLCAALDAGADINSFSRFVDHAGNGGTATPLMAAAAGGHADLVRVLLARGAAANMSSPRGETAVFAASTRRHHGALEALVEGGASTEVRGRGESTALKFACFRGQEDTVGVLLRLGSDPNARFLDSFSYLHHAAMRDESGVVRLLAEAGADVNARAMGGLTPLHMAAARGMAAGVTELLHWGADHRLTNASMLDAERFAAEAGAESVLEALARHQRWLRRRRLVRWMAALRRRGGTARA